MTGFLIESTPKTGGYPTIRNNVPGDQRSYVVTGKSLQTMDKQLFDLNERVVLVINFFLYLRFTARHHLCGQHVHNKRK